MPTDPPVSAPRTPDRTTFGVNLRKARIAAGLTQEQLARRLSMKRTTPISLWERSTTIPEPRTIKRLATALAVTPASLLLHVITPLDLLRGYAVIPPPDVAQTESDATITPLGAELQQWVELGVQAGDGLRRSIAAMLVEVISERAQTGGAVGAADGRFRVRRRRREPASDQTAAASNGQR